MIAILPPTSEYKVTRRPSGRLLLSVGAAVLVYLSTFNAAINNAFAGSADSSGKAKQAEKLPSQDKVEQTETAFSNLGKQVLPCLKKSLKDKQLLAKIEAAFAMVERNRSNPARFFQGAPHPLGAAVNGFSYVTKSFPKNSGIVAGSNGYRREIFLSPDFNPTDTGDLLRFLHEVMHIGQDDDTRKSTTVTPERYEEYGTAGGPVCIPERESRSVSGELEVLNAAMHGALAKAIRGHKSITTIQKSIPTKRPNAAYNLAADGLDYYGKGGGVAKLQDSLHKLCVDTLHAAIFDADLHPVD